MTAQDFQDEPGLFPGLRAFLFGRKRGGLSEHSAGAHILSYLLVVVESVTVVLVLGHTLITLLLSSGWVIRAIAAMALFILIASVWAADLALIRSFQRIPALARNRQSFAVLEHVAFILFVMLIEGITYGVVIGTLDTNASALLSAAPIIAPTSPLFAAQIVLRAILLGWTTVQLLIVVNPLPVQLATLLNVGKSIVGAHVERQLEDLDLASVPLAGSFQVYAAMARPPRRTPTLINGWLRRRDDHREREEARQADQVREGLAALDAARHPALPAPRTPDDEYPTGGGTPVGKTPHAARAEDSGPWSGLRPWEDLPPLSEVGLNSGAAATGQPVPGNSSQERAMQAYVNVLLNEHPLMSRKKLREELNVRNDAAREYYNVWYYQCGGQAKVAHASRTQTATQAATQSNERENEREAAEDMADYPTISVPVRSPITHPVAR